MSHGWMNRPHLLFARFVLVIYTYKRSALPCGRDCRSKPLSISVRRFYVIAFGPNFHEPGGAIRFHREDDTSLFLSQQRCKHAVKRGLPGLVIVSVIQAIGHASVIRARSPERRQAAYLHLGKRYWYPRIGPAALAIQFLRRGGIDFFRYRSHHVQATATVGKMGFAGACICVSVSYAVTGLGFDSFEVSDQRESPSR